MSEADTAREEAMSAFLVESGWQDAKRQPLAGDASTRRYIRVVKDDQTAMLMDQPQQAEMPTADTNATPQQRRALGYNAIARLAGADCTRFIAVAAHLRKLGLAAPEIIAANTENGFLLLEDFGDRLYTNAIAAGDDERALYARAIDSLVVLHNEPAPDTLSQIPFYDYDETALLAEIDLLTEWYLPLALGRAAELEEQNEHRVLWRETLTDVLRAPRVFVHRDFHAQNLIWMPDRIGVARVGLLDFQDAVAGHAAYDLISLLEDARHDVSPELAEMMIAHYLAQSPHLPDVEAFLSAKAILAAQRNAKIIGIFARLAKRDGNPGYLAHLPRVWRYMEQDLESPALKKLKTWYERIVPRQTRFGELRGQGERK